MEGPLVVLQYCFDCPLDWGSILNYWRKYLGFHNVVKMCIHSISVRLNLLEALAELNARPDIQFTAARDFRKLIITKDVFRLRMATLIDRHFRFGFLWVWFAGSGFPVWVFGPVGFGFLDCLC